MTPLETSLRRLRMLLRRERFDEDLDAEMKLHMQLREEDLRQRGLSPGEAKTLAVKQFGNRLRLREDSHDAWGWTWLEHALLDVRYAMRLMLRTPVLTAATVAVLALGIGANATMFGVMHAVWLNPLPYHEPDRIVQIWERHPSRGIERERVAPRNLLDWRAESRTLDQIAFWGAWRNAHDFTVVGPQGSELVRGAYVSANLFGVLGVRPSLGRRFRDEEDDRGQGAVAILGHELWQRRFGGDRGVIGKALTLDNYRRRQFTIVGVMPTGFAFPEGIEFWLPGGAMEIFMDRREGPWLNAIGRLRSGASLQTAESELAALQQRIARDTGNANVSTEVVMQTLSDATIGRLQPVLLLLQAAVVFVLLIACANVANLLLAHAAGRQREIAIRGALGADATRLLRQLLVESMARAVIAGMLGALLAVWGMALVRQWGPQSIPRLEQTSLNWAVLGLTLLLAVMVGVLFGLGPALHVVRRNLATNLREAARTATPACDSKLTRHFLLVSEVALTLMLVVGAGLLLQTLYRLHRVDLGFAPERLLTASLDMSGSAYTSSREPGPNRPQVFTERLLSTLESVPGIRGAAAVDRLPPHERSALAGIAIQRSAPGTAPRPAFIRAVTAKYFEVLGIPLTSGRAFTAHDTEARPRVAIVNETLARQYFPDSDPIGQLIDLGAGARAPGDTQPAVYHQIVGVVADTRNNGVTSDVVPEVYKPAFQSPWYKVALLVRTDTEPAAMSELLGAEVRRLNPNQPISEIRSMDDVLGHLHAEARFRTLVLGLFGALALLLAAIGIYAMFDNSVASRTQEIAVRLALGASQRSVVAFVLRQGLTLVALGIAFGLIGSVFVSKFISTVLFGVSPLDPITLGSATVLLTSAAACAMLRPAIRAATTNPTIALREG